MSPIPTPKVFPDRTNRLFGREATIGQLLERGRWKGVTAFCGPSRMGKSWIMQELARRLVASGYLVGYHDATGGDSHALYAISDLYGRWFPDSSFADHAVTLWEQHKDDLIARIGQVASAAFDGLKSLLIPATPGGAIRLFDGMAQANRDLQTAGLQLSPLQYDQALAVANLLARLSDRRLVLIFDGWEHSGSIPADTAFLEGFLRNQDDWPSLHVFLAVRNPSLEEGDKPNEAFAGVRRFRKYSRALTEVIDLVPMDLNTDNERKRLLGFLRQQIPATKDVRDDELLEWINGYPGVIAEWLSDKRRLTMQTCEDLATYADEAHAGRYSEFEQLFPSLDKPSLAMAAGLAFLPRLDEARWQRLVSIWGPDAHQTREGLIDEKVLIDDEELIDRPFETYGHDTRHMAARRWFLENRRALLQREGNRLVAGIAAKVTGTDERSRALYELLVACADPAQRVKLEASSQYLISAAFAGFGVVEGVLSPDFDRWIQESLVALSPFMAVVTAALHNRGLSKGQQGDTDGEIADYTAVVELPGAPLDAVVMALSNRGIAKGQQGDINGAMADYTSVVSLPGAAPDKVAFALNNRGFMRRQQGDVYGAMADYTSVVEQLPGAPPDQVATALINCGIAKTDIGDFDAAIAKYTSVIESPGVWPAQVAAALNYRGSLKGDQGDVSGKVADYTYVIELPGAPPEELALAFINRGFARGQQGDVSGQMADYASVIQLTGAPLEEVAKALFYRGFIKGKQGDVSGELADYTLVIEMSGAPLDQVAEALRYRGFAKGKQGDIEGAVADYTAVIELPGASAAVVAKALNNRGFEKNQNGDIEGAVADYTALIELPGAPPKEVALALNNRGVKKGDQGDVSGEMADYTSVIELPGAPPEEVAKALINRGFRKGQQGDAEGAMADYTSVVDLPGAPIDMVDVALHDRALHERPVGCRDGDVRAFTSVIDLISSHRYPRV